MRTLLVAALLATALSGCLSDAPDAEPDLVQAPLPAQVVHEEVTFADTVTVTAGGDPVVGCGAVGTLDRAWTTWTVAAPEGSNESHVADMVLTFSWAPTVVEADYVVYDPHDKEIARSTVFEAGASRETLHVDGKHPTGDFTIVVLACAGGGDVDVAGTATLGYVPA